MPRNTKKKLAILAGTSKCLLYAEAKFCASKMPGEVKYYECLRTEYCCAFGCCVSPGFHFHHLWYYWLLVIIMFLVCFGGGWWYRYWLQGRYRAAASAIPARASNARSPSAARGPTCQVQQARITYNSARNTVLLHRMWKGPQRNGTSSSVYNGNATTSTHYQNMNVVLNDANCPYYQLYGPPPSYETVIAQTRGKVTSPEHSASPRSTGQAGNALQNTMGPPQCYVYPCSPSSRYNVGLNQTAPCQNGAAVAQPLENRHDEFAFPHFSQYCLANSAGRQNFYCVPFEYEAGAVSRAPAAYPVEGFSRGVQGSPKSYARYNGVGKSSDTSDMENGGQSSEASAEPRGNMNPQLSVREQPSSSSDISDVEVAEQGYDAERHAGSDFSGFTDTSTRALLDHTISKVHGKTDLKHARGKHKDKDRGQHQNQNRNAEEAESFRLMDLGETQGKREDSFQGTENSNRTLEPQTTRRSSFVRTGIGGSFNERQRKMQLSDNSAQAERNGHSGLLEYSFGSQERLLCSTSDAPLVETSYEPRVTASSSPACGTHRYTRMDASAHVGNDPGRNGPDESSDASEALVESGATVARPARGTSCYRIGARGGRNALSTYEGPFRYGAAFEGALRIASPPERVVRVITSPPQSSPSNNVILPSFSSGGRAFSAVDAESQQRRMSAVNASHNLESKCKLDRSKSLD